jgi:hypothetical protein
LSARAASVLLVLASLGACQSLAGIKQRRYVAADAGAPHHGKADAGTSDAAAKDAGTKDASPSGAAGSTHQQDDIDAGVAPPSPLCEDYCETVTRQCTDDYAVYAGLDECLPTCGNLTEGTNKDIKGNTVGCRLNAARSVVEQADCAISGPGGAGTCGDNCESYCQLMSHACADPAYSSFWLGDVATCMQKCLGLRDRDHDSENTATDSRFSALSTASRDYNGDTVQCRLFHASAASSPFGAATHCWHAALAPRRSADKEINPCLGEVGQTAPRCKDYCHLIAIACPGDLSPYESEAQCGAVCEGGYDPGNLTDDGSGGPEVNNTLGCRSTHAYNALVGGALAPVHCGHSGPGGDGVCGDDCTSYCTLLERTCSTQFTQIGGMAGCQSECKGLLGNTTLMYSVKLAKSGASPLACRFYGLVKARSEPKTAAMSCDAAIGKGGC